MKIDLNKNNIICGDSKDWLKYIPSNSIQSIYIDPPFFTNKKHEAICGNDLEIRSFEDKWNGINQYISFLRERLIEAHRVLNPTGSIFLHCDYRANYKIREALNEVFGEDCFVNEIIWHYRRWTGKSKNFQKLFDTIYFYSKNQKLRKFNILYQDYTEGSKKRKLGGKLTRYSKRQDPYFVSDKSLNEKGVRMGNVWTDIPFVAPSSKERIGYPTQKPIALVKRIIEATTKEGDLALDFFGGSGTTALACLNKKRKFIIGDISPVACRIMIDRLKKAGLKSRDFDFKQVFGNSE